MLCTIIRHKVTEYASQSNDSKRLESKVECTGQCHPSTVFLQLQEWVEELPLGQRQIIYANGGNISIIKQPEER